ncbi:MAG: carbohydrate-binding family 9-like protein [Rhodothermales bacterium]
MLRPLRSIGLTILFLFAALGEGVEAAGRAGRPLQGGAAEMSTAQSFNPPSYVVYRTSTPIGVDGRLDKAAWAAAPWTSDFVDIEGRDRPAPRFQTRAKMLWDDEALYVAAYLEEPDVWATLTERDTTIYQDNAFEVFIDPDGDTHNYYELEVNALGTVWDLMLLKPYRDGGPALSAWDIRGLEVGVQVEGTLNDPTDTDEGWTLELALPWTVLAEAAPEQRPPRAGEQWRLNFARPQWSTRVVDGAYEKEIDEATGRPQADWWVWAPQRTVNLHQPEWWGYVQFAANQAEEEASPFVLDPNERVK